MGITGVLGAILYFPLRLIIAALVRAKISPNLLTFVGFLINVAAGAAFAQGRLRLAGVIIICAAIFDFVDGQVARARNVVTKFGGFFDSVLDRFSDMALFLGMMILYSRLHHTDYVVLTGLAMMFAVMTSYTRARAESLIQSCKVGFMERAERIVLFMIGAFFNRMAAVMWVIAVLSAITVVDRIYHTHRQLGLDAVPASERPAAARSDTPPAESAAAVSPVQTNAAAFGRSRRL